MRQRSGCLSDLNKDKHTRSVCIMRGFIQLPSTPPAPNPLCSFLIGTSTFQPLHLPPSPPPPPPPPPPSPSSPSQAPPPLSSSPAVYLRCSVLSHNCLDNTVFVLFPLSFSALTGQPPQRGEREPNTTTYIPLVRGKRWTFTGLQSVVRTRLWGLELC